MLEILIDDEDDQSTNKASVDAALKCNICEKLLEIPRSTRCKHTFCMKCIKEWIEKTINYVLLVRNLSVWLI